MTNLRELHDQAMNYAEYAFVARFKGDTKRAAELFLHAFELERKAAEVLKDDVNVEPTRSILFRSAATLAWECGYLMESGRLIDLGLSGRPPDEIAKELQELRNQIQEIIEKTKDLVDFFIASRLTPDEVRKKFLLLGINEQTVDEAFAQFRELTGRKKFLTPPPMLIESKRREDDWYPGADLISGARFWPILKDYLLLKKKWPLEAVKSIDDASDKIVAWLQSPWAARINIRGLVVGYVQSGKTANFTAVIAKAADAGYRFFIVLSGTKKSLRRQTQQRLERELIALNPEEWYSPTSENDFRPSGNATFFLSDKKHDKILCVVKKNATIIKYLITWLRSATPDVLRQCPFLVIDDEADEASINTARNQVLSTPENTDRTAINRHLVTLLRQLPKAAYIGYTATPFANVFIDPRSPDDLYPGDFIVSLPKPEGHFGTEEIFGRARLLEDETDEEFHGLDMVRIVPEEEIPSLKPSTNDHGFVPNITPSLQEALCYFWLACAARAARGQENEFSTMLIHTTQLIAVHNNMREQVEGYRRRLLKELSGGTLERLYEKFYAQWVDEHSRVSSIKMGEQPTDFESLQPYLLHSIERTIIVADNYRSPVRLSYDGEPTVQIAIGGNTLSRGLTLEGLLVSFFVRAASTYDTLLQMGRWFGYRPGYADLPRIWMTDELAGNFFDLATIEAEIRHDIENYELMDITPKQFGLRIRTHPDLDITAPLKMQHVVDAQVSYGGSHIQTVLFEHRDYNWLHKNIEAVGFLVSQLSASNYISQEHNGHRIFRGIPVFYIESFLDEYQFHPNNRSLSSKLLRDYLRDQNRHGLLKTWNVVIRGVSVSDKKARESISLGGLDVPLLQRARRKFPNEHAHIGVLMSKGDTGADLQMNKDELKNKSEDDLKKMRGEVMPGVGLLLIYPIAKDSEPGKGAIMKENLDAVDHLMGLGIVFPEAAGDSLGAQSYIMVDPTKLDRSDFEWDEEEEEGE